MTAVIDAFPWDHTPLGDRAAWPESLRAAVEMMLLSPGPMAGFWGPSGVAIFNDAFAALLPAGGASRLGRTVDEAWPEFGGLVAAVRAGRAPTTDERRVVTLGSDFWPGLDARPAHDREATSRAWS